MIFDDGRIVLPFHDEIDWVRMRAHTHTRTLPPGARTHALAPPHANTRDALDGCARTLRQNALSKAAVRTYSLSRTETVAPLRQVWLQRSCGPNAQLSCAALWLRSLCAPQRWSGRCGDAHWPAITVSNSMCGEE